MCEDVLEKIYDARTRENSVWVNQRLDKLNNSFINKHIFTKKFTLEDAQRSLNEEEIGFSIVYEHYTRYLYDESERIAKRLLNLSKYADSQVFLSSKDLSLLQKVLDNEKAKL